MPPVGDQVKSRGFAGIIVPMTWLQGPTLLVFHRDPAALDLPPGGGN